MATYIDGNSRRKITRHVPAIALGLSLAVTNAGAASLEDLLQMPLDQLGKVSLASGRLQSLSEAPATATVITAYDIQASTATTLEQILESVPGLHVSVSSLAYSPTYQFRGISSTFNPQVLVLVNGNPITSVFVGNRGIAWGGFPLEGVARIEIIRGPGSALYGADAFAGVINIITKQAQDIDGTQYGVRVGSFQQRDGWLLQGGEIGPVQAAFYLGLGRSEGQDGVIEADAQTAFDQLYGTNASLAPGQVNVGNQSLDARADLSYREWRLRAGFQRRELEMGAGLGEALDPYSSTLELRSSFDISYENPQWTDNWNVSAVAGFYNNRNKSVHANSYYLFPPGAFGGSFPEGMIGDPAHYERHSYIRTSAVYSGLAQHRLRVGAGFQEDDLYRATETKNFLLLPGQPPIYLGGIIDVTGTPFVYITPHRREVAHALLQDEWDFAPDWTLTTGVRHDHYSDFGGTTNPRLALVWQAAPGLSFKALHGSAFRAPSFAEQYNINNPVNLGNPALGPETIVTNELASTWQASATVQTTLTVFRYRWHDQIRLVPVGNTNIAQNSGNQTGKGAELEGIWDPLRSLRLKGNYSFQRSTDDTTGQDAGLAPQHHAYVQADWRPGAAWQVKGNLNHVAGRERQPGDPRPRVRDYTTADLAVARQRLFGRGELQLSLLNAFDEDAREPSRLSVPQGIPYDLPLPGRTLLLQWQSAF
ncbi:MAG: TonB-dependent receptor [Moraxellaceae bacterium]|nr:TonB-dependent receptor [Moraxellaceae bacterium]